MHEPGGLRCADPPCACYACPRSSYERLCASPGVLMTDIGIFEAIHTARSLRRFKLDPVPEALPPELRDRHPAELAYVERIRGASLYPAVQNILLACRALGLGTTITTNHIRIEGEVKAVLGLPEDVDTFAIMPIGWPIDPFGPLSRRPVEEVAHADRWGHPWRT